MGKTLKRFAIAGLACAGLLAAAPALADNQSVTTRSDLTFSPKSVAVKPGETVTFMNGDGGFHNVTWDDNGAPADPPNPSSVWSHNPSRTFSAPGTYRFYCAQHGGPNGSGMAGIVYVNSTGVVPPPPDKTPPSISKLTATSGKGRVTLRFKSSEAGAGSGSLQRLSRRKFRSFGSVTFSAKSGQNSIGIRQTDGKRKLTTGTFRLSFRIKDKAGNRSSTKTVSFTITRA